MSVTVQKYPKNCTWQISWVRTAEIGRTLRQLGFNIRIKSTRASGIDCKVFDRRHNLVLAIEITNYNHNSYQSYEKATGIVTRLNDIANIHNCRKLLVVSFDRNYKAFKRLYSANQIDVLTFGFQTVPTTLYNSHTHLFINNSNLIKKGNRTKMRTRQHLRNYLQNHNITP